MCLQLGFRITASRKCNRYQCGGRYDTFKNNLCRAYHAPYISNEIGKQVMRRFILESQYKGLDQPVNTSKL